MGIFKSLPYKGIEFLTTFNYTASGYVDPDMPLTYIFGFISNGVHNILQMKSLLSVAHSTLVAGSIICYVQVFDTYGVYTESTAKTMVSKQLNQQQLQDSILNTLRTSAGNSEASLTALTLVSAVLNQVGCDKAPLCDKLSRLGCSKVANTCGACKIGFIGDAGDSNALCVDINNKSHYTNNSKSRCLSDRDCDLFEQCDTSRGECWLPSKTCLGDCSGQGTCTKKNINSNAEVKYCTVTDVTCQAKCDCYGNFTGSDCSINKQDLLQRQALRSEMLNGLVSIASSNTISLNNLGSLSDTLSSLTDNVYEVSIKMVDTISQVALSLLKTATKSNATVNYESLSGILTAVNTLMQISTINSKSKKMLTLFSDLVSSQLVSGEDGEDYIYDSFRMKVASVRMYAGGQSLIVAPQTAMEYNFGSQNASSVMIQQNRQTNTDQVVDLSVSMIVTTASIYGPLASRMNSNPVQLKLISNSLQTTEITFRLIHHAEKEFTNVSYAARMGFNTTCHGPLDMSIHNFSCPHSPEILVHRCGGRQGVLTSYCQILAPKCALLDSESGEIDTGSSICAVIDHTAFSTTCKCILEIHESRRRLENVAWDGIVNVVSTSLYVANNFKDTFSSTDDINSLAALKRVLIVIIMFSVMWASGLMLIFGCIWRRKHMEQVNILEQDIIDRQNKAAQISYSVSVVQQNLLNYTAQVFPKIFSNEPIARRIWSEVCIHHRYLTLMTSSKGEDGDNQRILTCIQLLSVQTMLMFLLSLLYDIQGPSDDGTCAQQMSEIDCLSRKTVFDRSQSYCSWSLDDKSSSPNQYLCFYQDPKFTIETVLIIAVLVSLMVAICNKPIDMIFDLLTAPIADEMKMTESDGLITSVVRRMSNATRRMSLIASNTASAAFNNISNTRKLLVGFSTRKIPQQTETAQQLATTSMSILRSSTIRHLHERNLSRLRTYYNIQEGISNGSDNYSDNSESNDNLSIGGDEGEVRKASEVVTNDSRENTINTTNRSIEALSREIDCQRRLLKPSELEQFDEQWGIDPTGEFAAGNKSIVPCMKHKEGAYYIISKELRLVQDEVSKKSEKLRIATDAHTGLEILHLFIKDLLGRSTPAASIFETKTDEDFEHTEVISRNTKRFAMLALLGINIFFVYFAILTGFRRGVSWQHSYLIACIIQFVVEMALNETMECIWIQCLIPMLVCDEVRKVGDSIAEIVSDLCSSTPNESRLFLSAPEYLFVSTNLAKKFPHLMESMFVQSYYSHIPGELSKLWNVGSVARIRKYHSLRHSTLLTTLLSMVQYIGTAPFVLHRLFIRFIQPFVFGGLVLFWTMIMSSPVYVALMSLMLALLVAYSMFKYYYGVSFSSSKLSVITPIIDQGNDEVYDISENMDIIDNDNEQVINQLVPQAIDDNESVSTGSSIFDDIIDVSYVSNDEDIISDSDMDECESWSFSSVSSSNSTNSTLGTLLDDITQR